MAPKITGMLIDTEVFETEEIIQNISDKAAFVDQVKEA